MSKESVEIYNYTDEDIFIDMIHSWFGCVENFENFFEIEFSCGDGLFLTDIDQDVILLDKYDGQVYYNLFRLNDNKKLMKGNYEFRFTYDPDEPYDYFSNPKIVKVK